MILKKFSQISSRFFYKDILKYLFDVIHADDVLLESSTEEVLFNELKCGVYILKGGKLIAQGVVPVHFHKILGLTKTEIENEDLSILGHQFLEKSCKISSLRQIIAINFFLTYQLFFTTKIGNIYEIKMEVCQKLTDQLKSLTNTDNFMTLFYNFLESFCHTKNFKDSHEFSEKISEILLDNVKKFPQFNLMLIYEKLWLQIYEDDFENASKDCAILLLSTHRDNMYFVYLFCLLRLIWIDKQKYANNELSKKCQIEKVTKFLRVQVKKSHRLNFDRRIDLPVNKLIINYRAYSLITHPFHDKLLLIEMIFWNDEFKIVCASPTLREKYRTIINDELMYQEICKSELSTNSKVWTFLLGTAFEAAALEYQNHDYLIERCFGVLVYSLKHSTELDIAIFSKYLVYKICYQVLKSSLNSCHLIATSASSHDCSEYAPGRDLFFNAIHDYLHQVVSRKSTVSLDTFVEYDVIEAMNLLLNSVKVFKESLIAEKDTKAAYIGKIFITIRNIENELKHDLSLLDHSE